MTRLSIYNKSSKIEGPLFKDSSQTQNLKYLQKKKKIIEKKKKTKNLSLERITSYPGFQIFHAHFHIGKRGGRAGVGELLIPNGVLDKGTQETEEQNVEVLFVRHILLETLQSH